jgi:hypothetical protein
MTLQGRQIRSGNSDIADSIDEMGSFATRPQTEGNLTPFP